ncbi:peptidoglycan biosynthesis protein MviN/MurJ (putative lipid II flippase) [Mucilaginibacter sp. UYNi724]
MIFTSKFKVLGIIIVVGTIITGVIFRLASVPRNIYTKTFLVDFVIIGLAFYGLSKDKIEDERTLAIRHKSMAGAFIFSIIYCLLISLFNLYVGDFQLSAQELVMVTLMIYILCFTFLKRSDNNENID